MCHSPANFRHSGPGRTQLEAGERNQHKFEKCDRDLCHLFSSVQFTKGICIAQLSRMSHCAPAAREPVRFKFTPEARVGDVLVA